MFKSPQVIPKYKNQPSMLLRDADRFQFEGVLDHMSSYPMRLQLVCGGESSSIEKVFLLLGGKVMKKENCVNFFSMDQNLNNGTASSNLHMSFILPPTIYSQK